MQCLNLPSVAADKQKHVHVIKLSVRTTALTTVNDKGNTNKIYLFKKDMAATYSPPSGNVVPTFQNEINM